jgi:cytochrome c553
VYDVGRVFRWLMLSLALALPCAPALATVDLVDGANVFNGVCSQCHGASPLENVNSILNAANNPALIETQIQYNDFMQQLSYLTTQQIDDVAAYLATFTVVTPQTGYWWNPAAGGSGFTIEQNATSGNVFVATYLYATSGNPLWYAAGPATMTGSTFSAPLEAYSGGQTLTGAYQPATQAASPGTVSITFTDPSHGNLTWPGGTIPIERYQFTPSGLGLPPVGSQPQTGYWWNPAEPGRGYTVELQDSIAFIAAYMYDASGNAVWYAAGPAALAGNNTYLGNWTLYTGGPTLTGTYQAPSGSSNAGSLTIQFTSATAGMLTLPDGRQIPIQRYSF